MTPSWDLFKPNLALVREHYIGVIYLFLLPSLVGVLGSTLIGAPVAVNGSLQLAPGQTVGLALLLVSMVWQLVNIGPLTVFQLRAAAGKTDSVGSYYRLGLRYDWSLIMYYIVFGVLAIGGLILFIVPGLFVIRRYFLGTYLLVDQDLPFGEALKQSADMSKPYSGAIWGIIGVQVALIFAAALAQSALSYFGIIIGELIACSYVFLSVLRYREIKPAAKAPKA
ncbi:MAG: hypothetical protein JWN82_64 [Candidatus Saccharibacteria bacterium]|nr:hypothetical protein [Candidatus Saccharibacteria bacterium]